MKVFVAFLFIVHVSQHASAVERNEGAESVVLPCQVKAPVPEDSLVEWRRSNPSITVHVRRNNRDQPNDQNELYSKRTTLQLNALQDGDLSLTLTNISVVDEGTYTCTARQGGTVLGQAEAQLWVISRRESALRIERNVFIVLFTLTLVACAGCVGWIIKTSKNSKG